MSDVEREFLTAEQALAMLPDGDEIHVFVNGGFAPIGADWPREKVVALINGDVLREKAGPVATLMGHGLAVWLEDRLLFVQTRTEEEVQRD